MPLIRKARKSQAIREADAIREGHERTFARTFNAALGRLLTPGMLGTIREGLDQGKSTNQIMSRLGFFDEKKPKTFTRWGRFAETIGGDYRDVINDTIDAENKKRGWDVEPVPIQKAEDFPPIPVNAGAGEFIRRRSLTRAVDLSAKEEKRIRSILQRRIGSGAHSTSQELLDEITDNVGLTQFQNERLSRKLARSRELGMSRADVAKLRVEEAARIRAQRAAAIARTETNDALARGLNESWMQASQNGWAPKGTKKKWVAMPEEENSSEECQALNGDVVDLDEDFSTDAGEGFTGSGPPAHPNCRSTMILVFPD